MSLRLAVQRSRQVVESQAAQAEKLTLTPGKEICQHGRKRQECTDCGGSKLSVSTDGSAITARSVEVRACVSTDGGVLLSRIVEALASVGTVGSAVSANHVEAGVYMSMGGNRPAVWM